MNADVNDYDEAEWDDDQSGTSEATDSDLDDELSQTTDSPSVGALPGQSNSIALDGPGAGRALVSTGSAGPRKRYRLRDRDEALSGGVPLFIVHRPHQKAALMPRLLAGVVSATQGAVSTGASVALPQGTDETLAGWLETCAVASIKMADPHGYLMDPTIVRVPEVSDRALRWRPYLGDTVVKPDESLSRQRDVGANLLLTSGRALDYTDAQSSLDRVFAEGDDSLAELLEGERLALNLTLPTAWLTNATLRAKLFGQLVDQEQFDVWHIRVQWPAALRSLHQPLDPELLSGYKRLAQLATDEERALILPQTGLTGWLQMAFGAKGFGAGLFGSGHAFKEHSRGGNGGQTEVERYFEPTLLHSVERAVHDNMRAREGYLQCTCQYCPALHARTEWDHTLARLHLMHWLGRLAGISSEDQKSQEAAIRTRVRTALATSDGEPLAGISVPRHLPVWDRLL